jgi:hypothetical protein
VELEARYIGALEKMPAAEDIEYMAGQGSSPVWRLLDLEMQFEDLAKAPASLLQSSRASQDVG